MEEYYQFPARPDRSGVPRKWTREEVYRLLNMGFFHPEERMELIAGIVLQKSRHTPAHAAAISMTARTLTTVFTPGWYVAQQAPIVVSEDGEPEPDVVVFRGHIEDFMQDHPPAEAVDLLVEVADISAEFEQRRKAAYYAEARIADYWLVNLVNHCLEVRRSPVAVPDTPFGFAYSDVKTYRPGESVAPLAAPSAMIAVADLLPNLP